MLYLSRRERLLTYVPLQWLPNQLEAVLTQMLDAAVVSGEGGALEEIVKTARTQREILTREVAKYCAERGVAAE